MVVMFVQDLCQLYLSESDTINLKITANDAHWQILRALLTLVSQFKTPKTLLVHLVLLVILNFMDVLLLSLLSVVLALLIFSDSQSSIPLISEIENLFQRFPLGISDHAIQLLLVTVLLLGLKTLVSAYLSLLVNNRIGKLISELSSFFLGKIESSRRLKLIEGEGVQVKYFLGRGLSVDVKHTLLAYFNLVAEFSLILGLTLILFLQDFVFACFLSCSILFCFLLLNRLIGPHQTRLSSHDVEITLDNETGISTLIDNFVELSVSGDIHVEVRRLIQGKLDEDYVKSKLSWYEALPKYSLELILLVIGSMLALVSSMSQTFDVSPTTLTLAFLLLARLGAPIVRFQSSLSLVRFYEKKAMAAVKFLSVFPESLIAKPDMRAVSNPLSSFAGEVNASDLMLSNRARLKSEFANLTFTASVCEPLLIRGDSGSGKSTLLQVIAGVQDPNQGKVTIDGVSIGTWLSHAGAKMYFLPQNVAIFPGTLVNNLLVHDNREVPLEQVTQFLKLLNLEHLESRLFERVDSAFISKLSGGELKRIGIARALIHNPHILLLDEPTSGLDLENELFVFKLLQSQSQARTLIFTTHSVVAHTFFSNSISL